MGLRGSKDNNATIPNPHEAGTTEFINIVERAASNLLKEGLNLITFLSTTTIENFNNLKIIIGDTENLRKIEAAYNVVGKINKKFAENGEQGQGFSLENLTEFLSEADVFT